MSDLPPERLLAARLEFAGEALTTIAERCNIHRSTLWGWRQEPEYQAELRTMHDEARRAVIGDAIRLRTNSMKVLNAGIARMGQALGKGDMTPTEVASVTRSALDTYRAVCSQTGLEEASKVEHSGEVKGGGVTVTITPDMADRIMREADD